MGFMGLQKPGQKESVNDYSNVLVPLATAKRHETVIAEYERRRSAEGLRDLSLESPGEKPQEKDGIDGIDGNEKGVLSTGSKVYSPYTIEGLKAEVFEDVKVTGCDSAYDCEFVGWEGMG